MYVYAFMYKMSHINKLNQQRLGQHINQTRFVLQTIDSTHRSNRRAFPSNRLEFYVVDAAGSEAKSSI